MKPIKNLTLILLLLLFINNSAFSQLINVNYTTKNLNTYLVENNKKIGDIQVVILQENQGEITFSTGEAFGIKRNNSNEIVIFVMNPSIDTSKIQFSIDNDTPVPLNYITTTIEIKKDSSLNIYYSNAIFSIKF